jgi:predicted small lipoprotein YifL
MPARLLIALGLLLSLTRCGKKEAYPVIVPIGFPPAVKLTPTSRTMQRGDTLWLEASFSDSLLDRNSGRRYRVRPQDLKLTSGIVYQELTGINREATGIATTFRRVEKLGKAPNGGALTSGLELVYDDHYYRARIGLIPTKACITAISLLIYPAGGARNLGRPLGFIQLPTDAEGHEQKAVLDDSFYIINNGSANNFDLYSQHTRAFALELGTPSGPVLFEIKSTFTVEVK